MRKTYVVGDIHGGLKALKQVLEKTPIAPDDLLIFLGDYVDGWSESPQVIDFLINLREHQNCIFIRGNHDDLLLKYLKTNSYNEEWFTHGGASTMESYKNFNSATISKHIAFLEQLVDYYLDEQNRLFIHAGFTNQKGVAYEYFTKLFYWDRTLWETALALDPMLSKKSIYYPKRLLCYKEIFIGHTPTTRIEKTIPVAKGCVWNLDTGAAFTGPLTVMDVATKNYYQSDPLTKLYPNENGRN
jgi:serine/threonine protein phosphatase 1